MKRATKSNDEGQRQYEEARADEHSALDVFTATAFPHLLLITFFSFASPKKLFKHPFSLPLLHSFALSTPSEFSLATAPHNGHSLISILSSQLSHPPPPDFNRILISIASGKWRRRRSQLGWGRIMICPRLLPIFMLPWGQR